MSYSRWSNSYWYTYWLAQHDGFSENILTATLAILSLSGDEFNFQAGKLRNDVEQCLDEVRNKTHCSVKEKEELRGYMGEFLSDVDKEYPKQRRE